ncbi:MAG: fumarylacetoacetate hydrolase family protein [Proteobacteria bacterium]|nr:fumarylacetoacetate hydrolase family protein [Pseudomonadota bacterium]
MALVFSPEPNPEVPVQGSDDTFPVNRIYCVGQNYGDHVKEMGGDPKKNPPVFFSKPANAIVTNNQAVRYPSATKELHHEVELVVALGGGGMDIGIAAALACVFGYAVGIDFTRRDLQAEAKKKGKPWDTAKGFDQSAPISAIKQVVADCHPVSGRIALSVNREMRQDADLSDMIWSVAEIISELSRYYELKAGDLIFTGTPAGVASVIAGDHIQAQIESVGEIDFKLIAG